ncbi:MAG: UbiA prenyltransferase family protein [Fimbriimonadaceae bacterium]|nr:UbiA prenyltransferase family protein [Fimbriimonadaceae bacterium]
MSLGRAIWRSLRPRQWVKNVLLFGGLAFTGRWHAATSGGGIRELINWADLGVALAAFAVFCLLSSGGYLVNDLHDIEADRSHPKKCLRPIASGALSYQAAVLLALGCFAVALTGAWFLALRAEATLAFGYCALLYLVLTNAYSFLLKNIAIVDVLSIAVLFVVRAVAGCWVMPEPPSPWIIVCTLFGALFIALCKRRGELAASDPENLGETRAVLRKYQTAHGYSEALLDQMIQMAGTAVILSYSLYTFVRPMELNLVSERYGLMFTIPFVVYGVFRYLYLVHKRDIGQDPERIFTDPSMLVSLTLWGVVMLTVTRGRGL